MVTTYSEDTVIFNALSPSLVDKKVVYKALQDFLELKRSMDVTDRYNFVIFQQNGPDYLEDFTLNPGRVLSVFRTLEPDMVDANVAGGVFTAMTLIIDVFKQISEKCFRLIILTDSGSLKIPTEYLLLLQDLVDKIYTMPFFIDIIRINVDDTEEDEKLMSLAKRCKGEVHEISSLDILPDILEIMALKREVAGSLKIPQVHEAFFENIAENVIHIEQEETCTICFKKDEKKMVQCPNCLTLVHEECYANWAKDANIGIPHVFRCHTCFYLLKLDRKFVEDIHSGKKPTKREIRVKKLGFQAFLEKYELTLNPNSKHIPDPLEVIVLRPAETIPLNREKQKEVSVEESKRLLQMKKQIPTKAKVTNVKTVMCQNCGKIITSLYKECPKCYFPLL